jgi:hypothetical protein
MASSPGNKIHREAKAQVEPPQKVLFPDWRKRAPEILVPASVSFVGCGFIHYLSHLAWKKYYKLYETVPLAQRIFFPEK